MKLLRNAATIIVLTDGEEGLVSGRFPADRSLAGLVTRNPVFAYVHLIWSRALNRRGISEPVEVETSPSGDQPHRSSSGEGDEISDAAGGRHQIAQTIDS
jgi:hypothetical protein